MLLEADWQREANSLMSSLERSSCAVEEVTNWVRSFAEVPASSRREASSSGGGSFVGRWEWENWVACGLMKGRWDCGGGG